MAMPDSVASRTEPTRRTGGWPSVPLLAVAGLYSLETLAILGVNFSRYFPAISGHTLNALSGASVIAMSFVFTASVFGFCLMLFWREYQFGRLEDEIERADAEIASSEALAARIRRFKEKLSKERSLS